MVFDSWLHSCVYTLINLGTNQTWALQHPLFKGNNFEEVIPCLETKKWFWFQVSCASAFDLANTNRASARDCGHTVHGAFFKSAIRYFVVTISFSRNFWSSTWIFNIQYKRFNNFPSYWFRIGEIGYISNPLNPLPGPERWLRVLWFRNKKSTD